MAFRSKQGGEMVVIILQGKMTDDLHVSTLRLAVDQHIHTQLLLLLDGVGDVLFNLLLVLLCTDGAFFELQARPSDLCKTISVLQN